MQLRLTVMFYIMFWILNIYPFSVLKLRAKRRPQTLTSLVNMLIKLYESQENQIKGAFKGKGRFILTKNMEKTFLKGASWDNMKPDKQEKLLQRFLSGPPPKQKTVVSKDEALELNTQRRTAKKPGLFVFQSIKHFSYSYMTTDHIGI